MSDHQPDSRDIRTIWLEQQRSAEKDRVVRREPVLREVEQAEVSAHRLTGSKDFDLFLRVVQARIETLKASTDHQWDETAATDVWSHEAMIQRKVALQLTLNEIGVLEWVVDLPALMIEDGEQAREILNHYDLTG